MIPEWFLYGAVTFTILGIFIFIGTQIVKELLNEVYGEDDE